MQGLGTKPPARAAVVAAFAAIYLIWSSSYLAIHFGLLSIPPFLMAGSRFIVAGLLLSGFTLARGAERPTARQLRSAWIAGIFLFVFNNGLLVWAQQYVPSGISALLIASTPLWIVLLEWRRGGAKPTPTIVVGLVVGFAGMFILKDPADFQSQGGEMALLGVIALLLCALAWAVGGIYARYADMPRNTVLSTGLQLLFGGLSLTTFSIISGDASHFVPSALKPESAFAWVYLIIFASIIGFSSFNWLMRVAPPAQVATYAYVNPVIAVFLGWQLAGEELNARILVGAAVILTAVFVITRSRTQPQKAVVIPDTRQTQPAKTVAEGA